MQILFTSKNLKALSFKTSWVSLKYPQDLSYRSLHPILVYVHGFIIILRHFRCSNFMVAQFDVTIILDCYFPYLSFYRYIENRYGLGVVKYLSTILIFSSITTLEIVQN